MANEELAKIFFEMAELLELKNVQWKPRAYKAAAVSVQNLSQPLEEVYSSGGLKALKEIPGIGDAIAKKIIEFIETGKVTSLKSLRNRTGIELVSLLRVPGLGPKKIAVLNKELGVKDIAGLKLAAEQHKIAPLAGFGEDSEAQILKGIALAGSGERTPLEKARPVANSITKALGKCKAVLKVEVAGSLRRGLPTIGDVDVLVATNDPETVMEFFVSLPQVKSVIMRGPTKSSTRVKSGMQVDLRAVLPVQWGSALLYFTGSKNHNIELRKIAIKKGLKLNEYGLFKGETVVASKTEKEIYTALGKKFLPPKKRN